MFHSHPITQVFTDNTTAAGIANNTIKQHRQWKNEYAIFLDSWPKNLKKSSLHGNQDNKILQTILWSTILKIIINVYVLYIYIQIKCQGQYRSSYLRRPWKGVLIQWIPRWKNSARLPLLPEWRGPYQDTPFNITLWYTVKRIPTFLE